MGSGSTTSTWIAFSSHSNGCTDAASTKAPAEELLDYLYRRGQYAAPESAPTPGLILLDLNMPKTDGRQALQEIKADATLRHIPIVVLTTSYDLGVSSFITKLVTFEGLIDLVKDLMRYWFEIVTPPPPKVEV
jgi:two-component system, response regulator